MMPAHLTVGSLIGLSMRVTLLLALGWSAVLVLRRAPAGTRHIVWLTVIVGILLIPALARIAPMNVPMLPSVAAPPVLKSTPVVTSPNAIESSAIPVASTANVPRPTTGEPQRARFPDVVSTVVTVWLIIVALLLGRLALGLFSIARLVRRGRTLDSSDWTGALHSAAEGLGFEGNARLVMSDQVEMAFASVAFVPTIIVPVSAMEWSHDRRRAVLLHELAHVRRRDLLGHLIACVACAVYWFNPFVWAAARRLRIESELACDDVVLASGVRPSEYAQHLLDMVTTVGAGAPTFSLAIARPGEFEGRLVAILDRAKRRNALARQQVVAMVGLLGLLTVSIAAIVPVPRARQIAYPIATVTPIISTPSRSAPVEVASNTKRSSPAAKRAAPLTRIAIDRLLEYGTAAVINPMMMILRTADSLGLDGRQADSIATLNRRYMVRLNAIWSPVSSYYVSHPDATGATAAEEAFRSAPKASIDELMRIAPHVLNLLTPEQQRLLPARIAVYLDPQKLATIAASTDSAGVFVLDRFSGARRGGGRARGGG
jgi:beta-lactamase regulating signal transducer with metallopeptidase domain